MKKKTPISTQESTLFRNELAGIKPLTHDTIHPVRKASKQKVAQTNERDKRDNASFHFSDEYVPHFHSENPLSYLRDDEVPYLVKQIKRGIYHPDLVLDLHGLTANQAKQEIAALLATAIRERAECLCIIHGIGERILQRQTPRWLVQHPSVRAFHQATREWGGKGALLVVLEVDELV